MNIKKILNENEIQPSMTHNSDPYENAVADRINGILKQEFYIDKYNKDLSIMKQIIKETVDIYNEKRPHLFNRMLTPNQMHQQKKLIMKTYKTKNSIKNVFDAV
jgi:putative transposase